MKKIFITLLFLLIAWPAHAFIGLIANTIYRATPPSVTFNIPEELQETANNVDSLVNQTKSIIATAKETATNLQSAINATFNSFDSIAGLKIDSTPGQAENTFCGAPLDEVDVDKIAQKTKKNILTIKSKKFKDVREKQDLRNKFYVDNLLAIHAASKILSQELVNDIKTQIETAKKCAQGDGDLCNIPPTNSGGNNEVLFTYGQTLKTLDTVVRFWESVAALKARLAAIEAMQVIKPQVDTIPDEQTDTIAHVFPTFITTTISTSHSLSFAQASFDKTLPETKSNQRINFVVPAISQNEHPISTVQDKLDALGQISDIQIIVNQAINSHNMLKELKGYKEQSEQLAKMREDYKKTLVKLQTSEKCGIRHVGSVPRWSGVNLLDKGYRHDLRKGVSGWAWEAYQFTKAAQTSLTQSDDYFQFTVPAQDINSLKDDPNNSKAQEYRSDEDDFLPASKQEEVNKENRKVDLLTWHVGAEAAKIFTGSVIWTDTKRFYDKYLENKLDNIRQYLKRYTPEDVLAVVLGRLQGGVGEINETEFQQELLKLADSTSSKLEKNYEQLIEAKQRSQSDPALPGLEAQRQALIKKTDELNAQRQKLQEQISAIRTSARENADNTMEKTLTAKVVFPSAGQSASDKIIPILSKDEMTEQNLTDTIAGSDEKTVSELDKKIKEIEQQILNLEKQIETKNKEIALMIQKAQEGAPEKIIPFYKKAEDIKQQHASDVASALASFGISVEANLESYVKNQIADSEDPEMAAAIELARKKLMEEFKKASGVSISNLYSEIDAIIDKAAASYKSMGDDLYLPRGHSQIVTIHNTMISSLKAATIAFSATGANISGIIAYAQLAEADTGVEEEGFFVGNLPKLRDFKAPFELLDFDTPHVREVFHFDEEDYTAVEPTDAGDDITPQIRAKDLLKYGGEIPLIWQYMLKDRAFIENEYMLKESLEREDDCMDVAFIRGGIFPCYVPESFEVIDVTDGAKYYNRKDLDINTLPKCLLIYNKSGRAYHGLMDAPVIKTSFPSKIYSPQCEYSELGTLLKSDEYNNLSFRDIAFKYYTILSANQDKDNFTDEEKHNFSVALYASYARNQIGDFLHFAENEKASREDLTKNEQKYAEQMDELRQKLSDYGFDPADDFDVINDNDYELAVTKIKQFKQEKISQALQGIKSVNISGNEVAQEKIGDFKKLLDIIAKDQKGVMPITMAMASQNNLESELKRHQADEDVSDKYKQNLKEEYKQSYYDVEDPFCANY